MRSLVSKLQYFNLIYRQGKATELTSKIISLQTCTIYAEKSERSLRQQANQCTKRLEEASKLA